MSPRPGVMAGELKRCAHHCRDLRWCVLPEADVLGFGMGNEERHVKTWAGHNIRLQVVQAVVNNG
jgi:hypothetical protein